MPLISLNEKKVGRLLVGHEVVITVGEPWDFGSQDVENVLKGRIVEVSEGGEKPREQWVRLEVTPFEAEEGSNVTHLTARRRYRDTTGLIEQIAQGEDADANLFYDDQVRAEHMPEGTSPFLIGGVRLD